MQQILKVPRNAQCPLRYNNNNNNNNNNNHDNNNTESLLSHTGRREMARKTDLKQMGGLGS